MRKAIAGGLLVAVMVIVTGNIASAAGEQATVGESQQDAARVELREAEELKKQGAEAARGWKEAVERVKKALQEFERDKISKKGDVESFEEALKEVERETKTQILEQQEK